MSGPACMSRRRRARPLAKRPTVGLGHRRRRVERATVKTYRDTCNAPFAPFIGGVKLSDLAPATVRQLEDRLRSQSALRRWSAVRLRALARLLPTRKSRA